MPTSLAEYTILASAMVFAWILDDGIANLLLAKHQKGVKFRFVGARWLKREKAIAVALIQFFIAFILSYFLQDYFAYLFSKAFLYIFPISLSAIGAVYLYILTTLPYKIKPRHCAPSLILFVVSGLIAYLIS